MACFISASAVQILVRGCLGASSVAALAHSVCAGVRQRAFLYPQLLPVIVNTHVCWEPSAAHVTYQMLSVDLFKSHITITLKHRIQNQNLK